MIIRFKKTDEAHLKTLFPYVPKAEYELIMGMELPIPDSIMNKAKSDGFYVHFGVSIPISLIEENPVGDNEVDFGPNYLALVKELSSKFIHSKEVVDALYPGIMLSENVLLYGRGGHGKSEMTECFLKKALELGLISEEPFVQALGEGLTEEALFGGLEMKNFLETGKYEYLVENSFMNHEVVVFEELFDAPAPILLSLKDIITSGYFRKGNQKFKIRTKVIIGLTNKSKEDFSEDDSLEAFVQRFHVTKKVEWESYSKRDFTNLFEKIFVKNSDYYKAHKSKFNDLTNILELNNMIGSSFVSPRTAVKAAKLYAFGSSLDLVSDIDKEVVQKYFKDNKDSVVIEKSQRVITSSSEYLANIMNSCRSIEADESSDEIMDMLTGGTTNFGMEKILSVADQKVIKVSINRLAWLETHLNSTNTHETCKVERDALSEAISGFKIKLKKINTN